MKVQKKPPARLAIGDRHDLEAGGDVRLQFARTMANAGSAAGAHSTRVHKDSDRSARLMSPYKLCKS